MATSQSTSGVAAVVGVVLAAIALTLTIPIVAILSDLEGSDAAGNGMAQGFAALGLFFLFALIAALALLAALAGDMPQTGRIGTLILAVLWFAATWGAFEMLSGPSTPVGQWPLAIPALGPPLDRGLLPVGPHFALRAAAPARLAAVPLAALALVCSAFLPLSMIHDAALEREAARVADWQAKLDAMPADAPLWRWTPFLASDVYLVEQGAREAMRKLPSRQADAEAMLQRDEFPFGELAAFDLDPTPSLCDKARASLDRRAAKPSAVAGAGPQLFRDRQCGRKRERRHEMAGRPRLRRRRSVPRLGGAGARLWRRGFCRRRLRQAARSRRTWQRPEQ